MCGFAGIFKRDDTRVNPSDLHCMASTLEHRGPDQAGWTRVDEGRLGLAHTRLRTTDLHAGSQPMFSADGQLVVVFDGALYVDATQRHELVAKGHPLRTQSDAELLLYLYREHGVDMVEHLEGEFAFVLWDRRRRRLLAARDRSGAKPLFYRVTDREVLFASEAKAMLTLDRVDRALSKTYLSSSFFGAYTPGSSLFEGISSLRPGHRLMIDDGVVREEEPWWRSSWTPDPSMTFYEAVQGVKERVESAVLRRRAVDVPLCAHLTGELDSTIITALLARRGPVQAFHIGCSSSEYDTSEQALHVARCLGVEFEAVPCTMEDLAANLLDTLYHTEAHLTNPSAICRFLLSKHIRERGFRVALTGAGADELFAGYPFFKLEALWRMTRAGGTSSAWAKALWPRFRELEARSEGTLWTRDDGWKRYDHTFGSPLFLQIRGTEYGRWMPRLMNTRGLGLFPDQDAPSAHFRRFFDAGRLGAMHPLHASMELSFLELSEHLLPTSGDRVEMAHGLEGRTPFLDSTLRSFVGTIPPAYHLDMDTLREKHVLWSAFEHLMPPSLRRQHKHPSVAPSWRALTKTPSGSALADELLCPERLREVGVFRPSSLVALRGIRRLIPSHHPLHRRIDAVLGAVLSVQTLHQLFVARRPIGRPDFQMRAVQAPGMLTMA